MRASRSAPTLRLARSTSTPIRKRASAFCATAINATLCVCDGDPLEITTRVEEALGELDVHRTPGLFVADVAAAKPYTVFTPYKAAWRFAENEGRQSPRPAGV